MGRATSTLLAERGADVVIADVNVEAGATVAETIGARASFEPTDLRSLDAIESLITRTEARFGKIDGLANVAASLSGNVPFLETTPEAWQHLDDVNHRAVFFLSQAAARAMIRNERAGAIVHVASSSAFRPVPGTCAYAGTKGGVIGMTRAMAHELKPHRIRVNVVSPGHTLTEPVLRMTTADERSAIEAKLGGSRFMEPEDVAEAIIFLLSDAAQGMTGAVLHVNRGNYMPH